jgi:3-deoxy-D-manno-octulosonic-acid transferase
MTVPVRPTLPLRLYAGLTWLVMPLARQRVRARLTAEGIAPSRLPEREGIAGTARPDGPLVWFHGASVGETLSILPLVERLLPDMAVLVTSGTAASARILEKRLPQGAIHQFAPLDHAPWVARFLDHWQPDLAVLVESEIWPGMIAACQSRAIPLVLMNARLSQGSLRNWQRFPATARHLFGAFAAIYAQTEATARALHSLGADSVHVSGNMKAAAGAPPYDASVLDQWRDEMNGRPLWAAVSTHPGEEEAVLAAHAHVRTDHPGAVLILVPRHPPRADAIAGLIRDAGFTLSRRSKGDPPTSDVYLADTLGETGLWFRLAPVVFLGGSLVPVGGHNPWEPVAAGAATLTGPLRASVAADMDLLERAGAIRTVTDGASLGQAVSALMSDPEALQAMQTRATEMARAQTGQTDQIAAELKGLMHP